MAPQDDQLEKKMGADVRGAGAKCLLTDIK